MNHNGVRDSQDIATVSQADGTYTLAALPLGTYDVAVTDLLGSIPFYSGPAGGKQSVVVAGHDVTGVDFGLGNPGGGVTGYVFNDYNSNSAKGPSDLPVADVKVWADLNGNQTLDDIEPRALTNASGYYSMQLPYNLAAIAHVEVPAGSTAVNATTVALPATPAVVYRQANFALNDGTSLITGRVYADRNQNGQINLYEAEPNRLVEIRDPTTDAVIASVLTDTDGVYRFGHLSPGTYRVTFSMIGQETREGAGGYTVTLGFSETVTDRNFGFYAEKQSYTGRVFNDANGDGDLDSGETPIVGLRAFIDANYNGLYDSGEYTAVSDAAGRYTISGVPYTSETGYPTTITHQTPVGQVRTTYIGAGGISATITPGGSTVPDIGYATPTGLYISGYVYNDLNGNGRRDAGEPGLNNKVVETPGHFWDVAAVTDDNGFYVYRGGSGPTILRGRPISGWTPTEPLVEEYKTITLNGKAQTNVNFGFTNQPPPPPGPVTVEGEDAALSGGTVKSTANKGYTGAGYADFGGQNSAVTWTVSRAVAGQVRLDLRYANGSAASRPLSILVNGLSVGSVACAPTGTWTTWRTVSILANLSAGANSLKAIASTSAGGANLDNLTITPSSTIPPTNTASISGFAFNDANKNAKYDTGDSLAAGKTIWLDLDDDGVKDSNEPSIITDAQGRFTFNNLMAGTYHVRREFPTGYRESTPARFITLAAGQMVANVSIGSQLK